MCSVFYLQVYCIMISDYLQLERVKKIHVGCTCICRVCCHKWYCAKDIYCKLWSFIMTLEQIKPRLAFQSRKFRDWILGFWRLQSLIMGSSTPLCYVFTSQTKIFQWTGSDEILEYWTILLWLRNTPQCLLPWGFLHANQPLWRISLSSRSIQFVFCSLVCMWVFNVY